MNDPRGLVLAAIGDLSRAQRRQFHPIEMIDILAGMFRPAPAMKQFAYAMKPFSYLTQAS